MMLLLEKVVFETLPPIFFFPLLLNDTLDGVICLICYDTMFTLYGDTERINCRPFLGDIIKECIKLLG